MPYDTRGYRTAFVAAVRNRGIYPEKVKNLSVKSLVWEPPPLALRNIDKVMKKIQLHWDLKADRETAHKTSLDNAREMHTWLCDPAQVSDQEFEALGFLRKIGPTIEDGISGSLHNIEVHSVRPARRIGPDGQTTSHLVVEITQSFWPDDTELPHYRGGCTLLIDLENNEVSYFIRKKLDVAGTRKQQQEMSSVALRGNYFFAGSSPAEPLAMLHQIYGYEAAK